MIKARQAVEEIYTIIQEGKIREVYQCLWKGGANKPKFARLVGELPDFTLSKFTWEHLNKYGLVAKYTSFDHSQNSSFLVPGQQVQISTKINLNCLLGDKKYLAYDDDG